ncbi:hypothetical protein E4T56_gene18831 [Termitomyces sp. T112]|nr:hypothetical protein E4T56_gene18831 [Termitomyces sp. T112]
MPRTPSPASAPADHPPSRSRTSTATRSTRSSTPAWSADNPSTWSTRKAMDLRTTRGSPKKASTEPLTNSGTSIDNTPPSPRTSGTSKKALTIDHNPPTDGSTKVPEVREYTIGPGGPANTSSPHARLLGPASGKEDALHLPLSHVTGASSLRPPHGGPIFIRGHPAPTPPLPRNPSLRPYPSDPPPTALQPTHDPTPVLLQCKWHANSE